MACCINVEEITVHHRITGTDNVFCIGKVDHKTCRTRKIQIELFDKFSQPYMDIYHILRSRGKFIFRDYCYICICALMGKFGNSINCHLHHPRRLPGGYDYAEFCFVIFDQNHLFRQFGCPYYRKRCYGQQYRKKLFHS